MNNHRNNAENDGASLQSADTLLSLSVSDNSGLDNGYSQVSSSSSSSLPTSVSCIHRPILISDARTRSYLVGSVGSQDSLLSSEEMFRHFPSGKMNVLIISWNMSSKKPLNDLNDLLLPQSISYVPDVYAIGVQEAPYGSNNQINEWEIQLQTTIGPSHVMLHSCSIGVLHLSLFIRRDLIWFCTIPEDGSFNTRPSATNTVKTKGAIAISLSFFGTSFLFINCHLPAHEGKMRDRIEEYEKICASINLPKNLLPLKPRYLSKNITERYDNVFWFGDLNFRIEKSHNEVIQMVNDIQNSSKSPMSMHNLLKHDQLTKTMETGNAFKGFSEAAIISFLPTYKFKFGSNTYDTLRHRVPSFTDRILYRTKRPNHISCVRYDSIPEINTSDHKPVFALMSIHLKHGRDNASVLNAGLFNRNVYIEALKRRSRQIGRDIRHDESVVCSVT